MGFPPFLRQAKRHVEKCSTKQKTKHNGWKYKHSKNSSSSARSQLNHDDSYDESKSKSFVRKWITRQICFKWTMRACLSPQAHPSNKAPEIIEFLKKKNTLVLKGVFFFSDTFCRRLSFHKVSQTCRKPPNSEPPPFFCSKKVAVAFEDPRWPPDRWRQPWRQRWTLDLWSSYGSCSSGGWV